jgi:hypothetical protein
MGSKASEMTDHYIFGRAKEGFLRMTIICNGCLDIQASKENLINIQQVNGGLVGVLPEEGFIPKLISSYWAKGAAIVVCQDKETQNWLQSNIPLMKAWQGCRLEVFVLHKRVVAWFPGPSEYMVRLFQHLFWLKEGLNIGQQRVYKRKEESNDGVRLVLRTDTQSSEAQEIMKWHPFNSVSLATFSLLGAKPEKRKLDEGPHR